MPAARRAPLMLAWLAQALPAPAAPPAPAHPILGSWQLPIPGRHCTETYEYRADGTAHTVSAAEVTDTEYEISATPDEQGTYVVTDTIRASNGRPDCSGHITPVGTPVTLYLAPLRGGFLLCFDAALARCIGPMTRIAPPPAVPGKP